METDVAVIGGGIVGLAVAERLSRAGREVVLLERHGALLHETSSRNSEVLHSGLYYPTGTLKARLCVAGNASTVAWCEAYRVPCSRLGKLIVAVDAAEEGELDRLLAQGQANGVPRLERVGADFVRRMEPEVKAVAALWSPDTAIVDSHALGASFAARAKAQGATLALKHALVTVELRARKYVLGVEGPDGGRFFLRATQVVNCGGLNADRVAELTGLDVAAAGYTQHWVKGHYFRVRGPQRLTHLVYPVPARGLAGLGVHVTLGLDGSVRLGPDVLALAQRMADYSVPEELAGDFARAAAPYLPWVTAELLAPDQSGIRPKLSLPGEPVRDFVVAEESARGFRGWVNLVGIESPGLTCALELAGEVERLLASG